VARVKAIKVAKIQTCILSNTKYFKEFDLNLQKVKLTDDFMMIFMNGLCRRRAATIVSTPSVFSDWARR